MRGHGNAPPCPRIFDESKQGMGMAYLILSNGRVFEGRRIGAALDRIGELVFTTGMEGYLETLTDPSYFGQIVTHSFPLIGNYGVIEEDFEDKQAWAKVEEAQAGGYCGYSEF